MKQSPAQVRRTRNKAEAQARFISLVASGMTCTAAIAQCGRNRRCYEQWRHEDRAFADKIDNLRRARKDPDVVGLGFADFREAFFDNDTPPHHWRMIEALERTGPGEVSLVLAFPEAAKTTLMTDRICYLLGPTDPDHRICVISEGRDLAAKVLRHVQLRMTDEMQFGAYVGAFGPFKAADREFAKPWNAHFMSVLMAHNDEKEPSLEARGAGSTIYGGRYQWIALDDIQSSESLSATPKLMTYLRQSVLTRLVLGEGRTSVWGSRVGEGDIYEHLIDEGMVNNLVTIPALDAPIPREEHFAKIRGRIVVNPDCAAKPTWDRFSLQQLAERRAQVGESIWSRTYMQSSLDVFGATFSDEMVEKAKDRTAGLGRANRGIDVICAVDPAMESGTCAYVACAYDTDHLWVIDAVESRDTFRTEDVLGVIANWSAKYSPSRWVIEQNNWQKALVRDERLEALSARHHFEIDPHQTTRNKYDPVIGITMMPSSFIDGEITIPWDPDALERMGPLVDELRAWRPRRGGRDLKQDLVVALWFCWIRWQTYRQTAESAVPHSSWVPSWLVNA